MFAAKNHTEIIYIRYKPNGEAFFIFTSKITSEFRPYFRGIVEYLRSPRCFLTNYN